MKSSLFKALRIVFWKTRVDPNFNRMGVCLLLAVVLCASSCLPRTEGLVIREIDEFAFGQTTTIVNDEPDLTTSAPLVCGAPENFLHGNFTPYDYSVVLGMLVISLGIGKFQKFLIDLNCNCLVSRRRLLRILR